MQQAALRAVLAAVLGAAPWAAHAAVSLYLPIDALLDTAPLILEARVASTSSGYDPVTARLSTYVDLEVARVHRGPEGLRRVVLREAGGEMGDLVHVAEAAPAYREGERVLVFAEAAADGALRTAGAFFGKLSLEEHGDGTRSARRDLAAHGLVLDRPAEALERLPLTHLLQRLAGRSYQGKDVAWTAEPPEMGRLLERPAAGGLPFDPLSSTHPARWDEADSGQSIVVDVDPAGNPLADAAAAADAIAGALAAWTAVPESRLALRLGNGAARFATTHPFSPTRVYPPSNIVLFGDPYDDLSDPVACAGTLASGGYWRSATPGRTVNGVTFYPIRRLYVVFNARFECFLGLPRNLAEIAAHEIGHGVGLGHSAVPGAIMRGWAYGERGASLAPDDRDAVHCVYPHAVRVLTPDGGEIATAGSVQRVAWVLSPEAGPSSGAIDVELSTDGGTTWAVLAASWPADRPLDWTVTAPPGTAYRVRVVRRTAVEGFACTVDASDGSFAILAAAGAGTVPDGRDGPPLTLGKGAGGTLDLAWSPPCTSPSRYAVYAGTLATLARGQWDHVPLTCQADHAGFVGLPVPEGDLYLLVAAVGSSSEGPLGLASGGVPRPASAAACALRAAVPCGTGGTIAP